MVIQQELQLLFNKMLNSYMLYLESLRPFNIVLIMLLGTLRSNDADDNENVKKTIGLISKTTNSHVHHTFFVHFFPVFARLRRENA